MSTEDVLARRDAGKHLDAHTPMALEPKARPVRARRRKLDARAKASQAGYKKALGLANRERKKAQTIANREKRKIEQAAAKAAKKAADKAAKIAEAEQGKCDLPAVVTRDGKVTAVSHEDAAAAVNFYLPALCLDVETSGYWIGHKHYQLRTIQLGGEELATVLDADCTECQMVAMLALNTAEKLHAHSAVADLAPCVYAGLITWKAAWAKMYDSVLIAKLSDPKLTGSEANGLKDLSHDLLRGYAVAPGAEVMKNKLFKALGCKVNTEPTDPPDSNGWYMVDRRSVVMIRYAGSDVLDLAAVLRTLPALPVSEAVLDRERVLQAQCAPITYLGAALDVDHVKKKLAEHESSKIEHQENVYVLSDGQITNPSSPDTGETLIKLFPELQDVLLRSEKTQKASASKASLSLVKGMEGLPGIIAREILAYRHDVTTIGLLLKPLENLCDEGDSRMRPFVYTINADTGRMSMVRVNGQQFSKKGGVRACVEAGTYEMELTNGKWVLR